MSILRLKHKSFVKCSECIMNSSHKTNCIFNNLAEEILVFVHIEITRMKSKSFLLTVKSNTTMILKQNNQS